MWNFAVKKVVWLLDSELSDSCILNELLKQATDKLNTHMSYVMH